MTLDLWVGAAALSVLLLLEGLIPFRDQHGRLVHDLTNGGLALVNAVIGAALAPLLALSAAISAENGLGLTRLVPVPEWIAVLLALVLFDLWMYVWHRANHEIPLLWRLHRVHHTDPRMDASTALRFHPGEILISTLLNSGVILLIGLSVEALVLYKAVMVPIILLHHSNIRFPAAIDRALRLVIVPPSLHRVHHSEIMEETNSNYGTVLSVWDRLLGSLRLRSDLDSIRYGIGQFDEQRWQGVTGLLRLPFARSP
jgi:sterol desaturase/sphingolipid hydroxylase (fatty acid hydroxylase superfamily)